MNPYQALFKPYKQVIFYCVDPGCYYLFKEIAPYASKKIFFYEGWARRQPGLRCPFPMRQYLAKQGSSSLLVLGSQTNFAKTQWWIRQAKQLKVATAFVFDHWKNYKQHFKGVGWSVPDTIVVPDTIAQQGLYHAIGRSILKQSKVVIGEHLSLTRQVALIKQSKAAQEVISIFLDPAAENNQLYPGYTPCSILEGMASYIRQNLAQETYLIKPHPRQDIAAIQASLQSHWQGINYQIASAQQPFELMARSKQVWGVTSLCLVMAKLAGIPIKSFQLSRNEAGKKMTNDYIEANVVTHIEGTVC